MKTFIYLIIILDFTQTVICKKICNETDYDSLQDYPTRSVRRKREYTRWRAQTDKPTEFLVKVFDDDDEVISTPTKLVPLVPVVPRRTPKIIVSGITVRVPPRTTEPTTVDWADEYTRFKPPAPKPGNAVGLEPQAIPELPFKQSRTNMLKIQKDYGVIKPPQRSDALVRHPQRDESPPARPQFLPRTPAPEVAPQHTKEPPLLAPPPPHPSVQYAAVAPIAPVVFAKPRDPASIPRISTVEETTTNRFVIFSKYIPTSKSMTVCTTIYDGTPPTRTTLASEELYDQQHLDIEEITSNDIVVTRSTEATTKEVYDESTANNLKSLLGSMIGRYLSRTAVSTAAEFARKLSMPESKFTKETSTEVHTGAYPEYEPDGHRRKGDKIAPDKTTDTLTSPETTTPATKTTSRPQTVAVEISTQVIEEAEMAHASEESQTTRADFEYYEEKDSINGLPGKSPDKEGTSTVTKKPEISRRAQNQFCNLEETTPFNFTDFATLNEIYDRLRRWASRSPFTEIIDITRGNLTTMENPIYMLTIDDPSGGQTPASKQTVMVIAGIQGRDHYAVASAMYVLYQFIERSEVHSDLLNKYRFWIIPVFNPDGYEYSKSFTNRREWKKNLRQNWETCKDPGSLQETCKPCEEYGIRCYLQPCYGINLDRNFEYQWIPGQELRAEHPCGDLYAGKRQLSEIETFSLTNYLHEQRMPIYAFIAYKEGDVLGILYPYSHTRKRRTYDKVYRNRAMTAAAAAFGINGRPYMAGQTSEFLPLYAGGIEDWMDEHLGIDNSYAIVMNRPSDTKFAVGIERVAHEAYAAMDTLLTVKGTMTTAKPLHAFASARRRYGNNAAALQTNLRIFITVLLIIWLS